MKLPKEEQDVLVKLANGSFAVAHYFEGDWYTGKGITPSHEYGNDNLSAKVVSWSELPDTLENELESSANKPRLK